MKKRIIKCVVAIVSVVAVLLSSEVIYNQYIYNWKKTTIATFENMGYRIIFQEIGLAFTFGTSKIKITLEDESGKSISEIEDKIYNDGKSLGGRNITVVWNDTEVSITLHGEEQKDKTFVINYNSHSITQTEIEKIKNYTNSHNGMFLSVDAPEKVPFGKKFYVVAKITNTSSESITYTLPQCTPDMHLEIETVISGNNNRRFIDCDTFGKFGADAERIETLLPGESFEQKMCFLPGWTDNEFVGFENAKITMFERGIYNGTAVFNWDTEEDISSISLDFPITVV